MTSKADTVGVLGESLSQEDVNIASASKDGITKKKVLFLCRLPGLVFITVREGKTAADRSCLWLGKEATFMWFYSLSVAYKAPKSCPPFFKLPTKWRKESI